MTEVAGQTLRCCIRILVLPFPHYKLHDIRKCILFLTQSMMLYFAVQILSVGIIKYFLAINIIRMQILEWFHLFTGLHLISIPENFNTSLKQLAITSFVYLVCLEWTVLPSAQLFLNKSVCFSQRCRYVYTDMHTDTAEFRKVVMATWLEIQQDA